MIALIRCLDRDTLQAVFIEQVASELRTRPGVAISGTTVTLKDAPNPQPRRVILACLSCDE
jgi:hypothetical protein